MSKSLDLAANQTLAADLALCLSVSSVTPHVWLHLLVKFSSVHFLF